MMAVDSYVKVGFSQHSCEVQGTGLHAVRTAACIQPQLWLLSPRKMLQTLRQTT